MEAREEPELTAITFRVEGDISDVNEINKLGRRFVEKANEEVLKQAGRKLPSIPVLLPININLPMFIMEYRRINLGCDIRVKLPIPAKMKMLSFVVKKIVKGRKKILKRYFKDSGVNVTIRSIKE